MKIMILVPPLKKEFATLSQNRQFQYYEHKFLAYPVISACIATMFKKQGHEVTWCDCIADDNAQYDFVRALKGEFDKVYIEVKAPVYDEIRELNIPNAVYYGDHARHLGIDGIDYDHLPHKIDRKLTKWKLYAYENGNYSRTPGTYIMAARDCWWGHCTFCAWTSMYNKYHMRQPDDVLDEIERLVDMGVKEIFDDSGTFPTGQWLYNFCDGMIHRGLNHKVKLSCNMRFNRLGDKCYKLMKKAGFRMVLFGLESIHQYTLDRLEKGIQADTIEKELKSCRKAGLCPHITVMFGLPWESYDEALQTAEFARRMMIKGYAYSAQATLCVPYPHTKLYKWCDERGYISTRDLTKYDQSQPVMSCHYNPRDMIKRVYSVMYHPRFVLRKLLSIRNVDDVRFLIRSGKKVMRSFLHTNRNACT